MFMERSILTKHTSMSMPSNKKATLTEWLYLYSKNMCLYMTLYY